jgi:Tfp pilus assembly protein PilO
MPQEDDLDQEIRNMEMLHQQVQQKKEKMARLADLQRQIDEASEEVRHLA